MKLLKPVFIFFMVMFSANSLADYKINVDLTKQRVLVSDNGTIIKEMICSSGAENTPTPSGQFSTYEKSDYEWFNSIKIGTYYWTRFNGHISFHSTLYDKDNNLIISENDKLGTPASAGCIRLSLEDAKWVYDNIPLKTTVIVS